MSVIREGEDLILQLRYTQSVGAFNSCLTTAELAWMWGCLFHSWRQPRGLFRAALCDVWGCLMCRCICFLPYVECFFIMSTSYKIFGCFKFCFLLCKCIYCLICKVKWRKACLHFGLGFYGMFRNDLSVCMDAFAYKFGLAMWACLFLALYNLCGCICFPKFV